MKIFHNLDLNQTIEEIKTTYEGLSDAEAQKRLTENGKNQLKETKKRSMILKFFDQFKDVMIIVLLVAALISGIIAVIQKEYGELIDSGLILLIVIVNAIIGLAQESKAEAALEALKNMNKPFAKVMREGKVVRIKSEDIVIGDVIVLEAGDIVPADLRLFETNSLKIEEAALTGESVPTEKDAEQIVKADAPLGDRKNMAYSSGVVAYGRGKGFVTATGMDTEVGKIADMLNDNTKQTTPLQLQLAKTAKVLSLIVLIIAVVIFGASVIRKTEILDAFLTSVAIAVAAIPEGLPAVVTIVLALGVQKMSTRKAIVRNLPAVETLGCCQVICSDKTGTLTLNQMTVKQLYTLNNDLYTAEEKKDNKSADYLVNGMVLCNDTVINGEKLLGDPTETALVAYAIKNGLDALKFVNSHKRVGENPFDSVRKLMSTVNVMDEGKIAFIKGAPDILISKCSYILEGEQVRPITDKDIKKIKEANSKMAKQALRVLAVAYKTENTDKVNTIETDMIFTGLVGMIDPPRPEVTEAIKVCKKAGMKAIMITGDHLETAAAIAKEIGILTSDDDLIITGADLDKLSDEEFFANLHRYRVFARVSPENKVRIVKAFKKFNIIVAMTGDGVNDAPSIKSADIGIGMGITGTDVSKGVADMVLADDNFATIIGAVEEGRKVYNNIKKAVQYLLSANIAEVLALFIASVFLNVEFLTPVMILWVNLVTDSLPALALATEKAEKDIMNYPPRKVGDSLFAGKTGRDILIQGIIQTVLVMGSFLIGNYVLADGVNNHKVAMTMAFVTLCFIQLFHTYNLRSQKHSLFISNPFANRFVNIAFIVGVILTLAVIILPFMNNAFSTVNLRLIEWLISVGLSILVIPFVELQKFIEYHIHKAIKDNKK